MNVIDLKYGNLLKGKFEKSKLNFLFTFQVNCPGCFFYGIPIVNRLYDRYKDKVSFLGLSTAFEDFGFNTEENTLKLLQSGEVVGETRKALHQYGQTSYPEPINFPVAMDFQWKPKTLLTDEEPKAVDAQLSPYLIQHLKKLPSISHTFWLNTFKGTPTMLIFDDQEQILEHWFGHVPLENIEQALEKWQKELAMHR